MLQRYGISKLLLAVKNHAPNDNELTRLIEDLTIKLVAAGRNCLSVNVLFHTGFHCLHGLRSEAKNQSMDSRSD